MKEAYRHLTAAAEAKETAIGRLAEIIAILRVECPWDRVQTHESLRAGMLEEAYEVVEAIDNKDLANLREELGDAFYVTLGLDHCVSVYTEAAWQRCMEKYNNLSMSQSRAMRLLLANAAKCEPDMQGRFLIPTELRDYANIRQNVVFIGQGNHAEIWDAEAYEAMEAEMLTPENLAAAMEELGF